MTPARGKVWIFSAAGALLVLGCAVLLNVLSAQFHLRLDFSAGKLYSLSPGSKRILKRLESPIELRVYFTKELPPEYAANRSYVEDLLREYRSASRGKVRTQFVSVDAQGEGREEALKQGIIPVQFNVVSREKYEVREGFMGLVIQREDKKEVIPVITGTGGFEYDLTSRIVNLTRESRKTVGILSGSGALSRKDLHPRVREMLERNYEITDIDPSKLEPGATIAAEVSALLVLGPNTKVPDAGIYALDQFLMSGRPLVYALDSRRSDLRAFLASDFDRRLKDLVKHYGVRLRQNFVLDAQNQPVQVSQSRGFITFTTVVPYPLFVVSSDLDADHPVTRHLGSLTLPLVAPLEISSATVRGDVRILARSSKFSWLHPSWERGMVHSINPLENVRPADDDPKGPFALAAALEGPFSSYFSSGPAASGRGLPEKADPAAFVATSRAGARLIVVGTSRFAHAGMPVGEAALVFLVNLVDWMALDDDLISIRSKGAVFRPLREIPAAEKTAVKWASILFPAFLVAIIGLLRLRRRRRLRTRRGALYGHGA